MSDDTLEKILQAALRSEHSPSLSDEIVDAYLASHATQDTASVERIRALYALKVLGTMTPHLVERTESTMSFGRFIQNVRTRAGLSRKDIAAVLEKDSEYIERLEAGSLLPWNVAVRDFTSIISVFRIHFTALQELVTVTFSVAKAQLPGQVAARSHGGKVSMDRGDTTRLALERYLARNTRKVNVDSTVASWLAAVHQDLERQKMTELL